MAPTRSAARVEADAAPDGRRRGHRLQLVGRLRASTPPAGQAAAGQRPAPGARHARASGSRSGCTATRSARSARSTSRASPSRACPGVVIGHNARIAWGLTNLGADVTDLYLERVDGDLPLRRRGAGRRARTEDIRGRRGGRAVTRHRPVRPGTARCCPTSIDGRCRASGEPRRSAGAPPRRRRTPWRCGWTALQPRPTDGRGVRDQRRAEPGGVPGSRRAVRRPGQNIVYADVDGHIGYQAPGASPSGDTGAATARGRVAGPENDWTGGGRAVPPAAGTSRPARGVHRHGEPGRGRPRGLPLVARATPADRATAASASATAHPPDRGRGTARRQRHDPAAARRRATRWRRTLVPCLMRAADDRRSTTATGSAAAARLGLHPAGGLGRRLPTSTWSGGTCCGWPSRTSCPSSRGRTAASAGWRWSSNLLRETRPTVVGRRHHRGRGRGPRRRAGRGDDGRPATTSPACKARGAGQAGAGAGCTGSTWRTRPSGSRGIAAVEALFNRGAVRAGRRTRVGQRDRAGRPARASR